MQHDIVIRRGLIVDGTGRPAHKGDIAIDGDTITAIGEVSGQAREEIHADGMVVTPGFVDLHTHLDAQIGWDTAMTSVTWHGVTTALLGNCGVTFAPCKPADREFLAGMMDTVEDIPRHAILTGLPWDWEFYGDYLASLERLGPMINVAGLVGHSATRFYVMGERAIEEQATPDEIAQIAALAGRSVREGAFGFSVNRMPGHVLPDRRPIPGTFASHEEVIAIARAVGAEDGLMQTVPNFQAIDDEMSLMGEEGKSARILFSAITEHAAAFDEHVRRLRQQGVDITAVAAPRGAGGVGGLFTDNFWRTPAWDALRALPFEARLQAIEDADLRTRLVQEVQEHPQHELIAKRAKRTYPMGLEDRPVYTTGRYGSLADLATEAGEHYVATWLRLSLESRGRMLFHLRDFNVNLEHVQRVISTDWALPGLGDAGAHVSQGCDSGWATFILSHWYRDAKLYTLEDAVRRITGEPARVLGLQDRGRLAVGLRADINVIDMGRLAERQPYITHQFPGGAPHFQQRAHGYVATLCNGRVILRDDEHTGEHAGRVLRSGRG